MAHTPLKVGSLSLLCAMQAAAATTCLPAPVSTAEQAACLARAFVSRSQPQWEVVLEPKDTGAEWLVEYRPKSLSVRGGSGVLQVAKSTGAVTLVRAER